MRAIGVLVPLDRDPRPPDAMPLSRAALALREAGVTVIFGASARRGRLLGLTPEGEGWRVLDAPISAAYDRFPDQARPTDHALLLAHLGPDVGIANPPAVMRTCRDKWSTQRALDAAGVPAPPAEVDPRRFEALLADWGAGFLKPRFGAFGIGVRRVVPGDPLPDHIQGLTGLDPAILQRAVPPPPGVAGLSVRALVQRVGDDFVVAPLVARTDLSDPVVNVRRGASAAPAEDVVAADVHARLVAGALAAARAIAGEDRRVIELGVDLVVDPDGRVFVIEVNARPYGRLTAIAEVDPRRFGADADAAAARPLWAVAALAGEKG